MTVKSSDITQCREQYHSFSFVGLLNIVCVYSETVMCVASLRGQILCLCLVAVAAGLPEKSARIVNYQYGIEEDGAYQAE